MLRFILPSMRSIKLKDQEEVYQFLKHFHVWSRPDMVKDVGKLTDKFCVNNFMKGHVTKQDAYTRT